RPLGLGTYPRGKHGTVDCLFWRCKSSSKDKIDAEGRAEQWRYEPVNRTVDQVLHFFRTQISGIQNIRDTTLRRIRDRFRSSAKYDSPTGRANRSAIKNIVL